MGAAGLRRVVGIVLGEKGSLAMGFFTWPWIRGLPHNIQISTTKGPYDIRETICAPV
jgi:hypothetical protein